MLIWWFKCKSIFLTFIIKILLKEFYCQWIYFNCFCIFSIALKCQINVLLTEYRQLYNNIFKRNDVFKYQWFFTHVPIEIKKHNYTQTIKCFTFIFYKSVFYSHPSFFFFCPHYVCFTGVSLFAASLSGYWMLLLFWVLYFPSSQCFPLLSVLDPASKVVEYIFCSWRRKAMSFRNWYCKFII